MLTSEEKKQIGDWSRRYSGKIGLRLLSTGDSRTAELKQFCDILSECAPGIRILTETAAEQGELPFIEIRPSLRYRAVPLGRELGPFLEALEAEGCQPSVLLKKYMDQIRMPASLRLHIARHCPFCPQTLRQMLPLTRHGDRIRLTVVDAELFPETAAEDQIRSVPTLVLDENFRWTGAVRPEEVARILADRDPAALTADSLEQMLKEGRAARLAEMMQERGMIFPAFPDLLCHEKWPVRLGAMVVAETLAESGAHLLAELTGPLWERFAHADEKARGDILYVIGISGSMEDIPRLEKIHKGDSSSDIREAAAEAISQIFTKDIKEETWVKSG
ncbi:MAG: thioredoxin family protein [Desulfobacterales bacterium]